MRLAFALAATIATTAALSAVQTLTIVSAGKRLRIPVHHLGTVRYVSFRALSQAMGQYRSPDELVVQRCSIRWSAPAFFFRLSCGQVVQVVQCIRPSINHNGSIHVPLDECMAHLAEAGIVEWDARQLRATVMRQQQTPPIQPTRPLRYQLPPGLRRPSLERLRTHPVGYDENPGMKIMSSSPLLASLVTMPVESSALAVKRVVPTFSGDTTRIEITFDRAIAPDDITLSKRGKSVTISIRNLRASKKQFRALSAVRFQRYSVESISGGSKLVMVLRSEDRKVRTYFRSARTVVVEISPAPIDTRWALDCIVLDAGHGGHDVGAIGVRGTLEKNVTLAVARELARQLATLLTGVRVIMTRSNDQFVELHRRGEIANRAGGKLFVSLHCNAATTKPHPARGVEIYVLSPARTDAAAAVAARENSSIALEQDSSRYQVATIEQQILASVAQQGFLTLSHRLASLIDSTLRLQTTLPSRGVQSAGFLVLVGASMPSVLVEMGFLSNKTDEHILSSRTGQRAIARSIAEAIVAYVREYNRMVTRNGHH